MTLTKEEIEELIKEKLAPISIHRRFQFKDIQDFPFEVLDADGLYERDYGESFSTQSIISDKGLFHLPKLSFTNEVGFHSQKWAIDVNIKKFGGNEYHNEIQLPYSTDTHSFIKGVKGRVNRKRNITIFVHNQQNTSENIEINILDFNTLLSHLIIDPVINGTKVKTKYLYMGPHDSSKKLFAFLKSFNFDFDTIDDFFSDIFWVKLFEYLTLNTKKAGDSIYFDELKLRAIDALKQKGVILGEKEKTYENEENLEIGLKETLKELCSYRVFLKGFKLKCNKCSSNFWYPLKEISETVTCKGCMLKFKLPIEPKFAYKLNDLIKNNIFQSQKEYDGNLTVIRTLVYIYDNCRQSFEYNPQINLFDKIGINKPCSEIDIVCTSDGKFIIGEAKHNSSAFSEDNNKSLKSLVDIAKEIYPDKIIISCTEDDKGRLDKAKKRLMIYFNGWEYMPEIETIVLDPPNDFSLGGHRYFYY
jgi:hypothetical protein